MANFPREFSVETAHGPLRYRQLDGYCAVHTASPHDQAAGELMRVEPNVAICSREIAESQKEDITPVYQVGEKGPLGVPTGQIFVRLAEGEDLNSRREELAKAGFEIERSSPAMPNAGWIRAASGRAADALVELSALQKLRGIKVVEPVMLMPRQKKAF